MDLQEIRDPNRIPVFICVGMPQHPYDSLAPRLGERLNKFYVIGTMEHPVHAKNIHNWLSTIRSLERDKQYQVIAIDAVLTKLNYLYKVKNSPCRPGAGLNKQLPQIGEATIMINPFYGKPMSLWRKRLKLALPFKSDFHSLDLLIRCVEDDILKTWRR